MKRLRLVRMIPAALLLASLGAFGLVNAVPATAASVAHVKMATKTWHGKITKIDAKMGSTYAFTFEETGMKTFVVHYNAMTKFTMGTMSDIKVGQPISVTGTLKGTTITATAIDL